MMRGRFPNHHLIRTRGKTTTRNLKGSLNRTLSDICQHNTTRRKRKVHHSASIHSRTPNTTETTACTESVPTGVSVEVSVPAALAIANASLVFR